jgi:uncharacterized protein
VRNYELTPFMTPSSSWRRRRLLHDIGMSIHRTDHEGFSLFLARPKLKELLADIYDTRTVAVIQSEVLHAIIAHRSGGRPLTVEAGIVGSPTRSTWRRADRASRSPTARPASTPSPRRRSRRSTSRRGAEKPVRLRIEMSNSAGVFQLDQLFREKLAGSGLEPYIELEARIEGEQEKRLFQEFRL